MNKNYFKLFAAMKDLFVVRKQFVGAATAPNQGHINALLVPSLDFKPVSLALLSPTFKEGLQDGKIQIVEFDKMDHPSTMAKKYQKVLGLGYETLFSGKASSFKVYVSKKGLRSVIMNELFDLDGVDKPWEDRREEILLQDGDIYINDGEISWKVIDFHEDDAILDGVSIIPDSWSNESFKGVVKGRKLLAKGLMIRRSDIIAILEGIGNDDCLRIAKGIQKYPEDLFLVGSGAFKFGNKAGNETGVAVLVHGPIQGYKDSYFKYPVQLRLFYDEHLGVGVRVPALDTEEYWINQYKEDFYEFKRKLFAGPRILFGSDVARVIKSLSKTGLKVKAWTNMALTLPVRDDEVWIHPDEERLTDRVWPVRLPVYWPYSHKSLKPRRIHPKGETPSFKFFVVSPTMMHLMDGDNDGDIIYMFSNRQIRRLEMNSIAKDLILKYGENNPPSPEKFPDGLDPTGRAIAIMERQWYLSWSALMARITAQVKSALNMGSDPELVKYSKALRSAIASLGFKDETQLVDELIQILYGITHGLKHGVDPVTMERIRALKSGIDSVGSLGSMARFVADYLSFFVRLRHLSPKSYERMIKALKGLEEKGKLKERPWRVLPSSKEAQFKALLVDEFHKEATEKGLYDKISDKDESYLKARELLWIYSTIQNRVGFTLYNPNKGYADGNDKIIKNIPKAAEPTTARAYSNSEYVKASLSRVKELAKDIPYEYFTASRIKKAIWQFADGSPIYGSYLYVGGSNPQHREDSFFNNVYNNVIYGLKGIPPVDRIPGEGVSLTKTIDKYMSWLVNPTLPEETENVQPLEVDGVTAYPTFSGLMVVNWLMQRIEEKGPKYALADWLKARMRAIKYTDSSLNGAISYFSARLVASKEAARAAKIAEDIEKADSAADDIFYTVADEATEEE